MKSGLIVASYGRPAILRSFLQTIKLQSLQPDEIVLSVVAASDLPDLSEFELPIKVICGPPGSCVQRNRGIDYLQGRVDCILFLDDDFWMSPGYVASIRRIFETDRTIVGVTGFVIKDGATSRGFTGPEADSIIADDERLHAGGLPSTITDVDDTYGCNMAFRASCMGDIRFDERLPLYGWQEDVDFSAQFRSHGRVVRAYSARGVHLGTKTGKTSGVRFGYSQVVNPIYVAFKGNMAPVRALRLVLRNITANVVRSFFSEPYVDRRGRLRGNLIGLADLATCRLDPSRVLRL